MKALWPGKSEIDQLHRIFKVNVWGRGKRGLDGGGGGGEGGML